MKVYLDNAATTTMHPEVIDAMTGVMKESYGNPSSIHGFGRNTRAMIEKARRSIANLINANPSEIFFTSGGTEANNMAINGAIKTMGIGHAITSPIEHHAVLHTLEHLEKQGVIKLSFVNLLENGHMDLEHLQTLLAMYPGSFVSLMHGNNEIGNLLPLQQVANLCNAYDAIFHSDTVQTMGHYAFDMRKLNIDFVNCAAHKFHGPKGIGFIYINEDIKIEPFIYGGAQERNMRGGTENLYGIIGLAKAMEVAHRDMEEHQQYIIGLKNYMKEKLQSSIPGVSFHGDTSDNSLYTVLNVCFPENDVSEMLLFSMDINGIAASGGSACSSGSNVGSHVLKAIKADPNRPGVRFSFSKYNTKEEIDFTLLKLQEILKLETINNNA
jgi:cysteine desulfurase